MTTRRKRRWFREKRPPWEPIQGQVPYDSRLAEARRLSPMVVETLTAFGETRWPRRPWAPWRRRFDIYFEGKDEGRVGKFVWYVVARQGWQDRLGKPPQRDYYAVELRFSLRQDQPAVFDIMGHSAYLNRLSLERVLQEILDDAVQPHRTDAETFQEMERLV
ncbi:MAG: hypothetical protein J7M34_04435 [Anaerolineae bacterium]|nr:hypothetical protein [Anaerolineae bacterium]